MRNRLATSLLVVLVSAGALSCDGKGRSLQSAHSSAPAVTPSGGLERVGLSLNNDGQTIVVRTSSDITLILGDMYRWTDPTSDGVPVEVLAFVSDAPEGGQIWKLIPGGTGVAVLRSEGSPACRPTTPGCPESDRIYTVTLQIRD